MENKKRVIRVDIENFLKIKKEKNIEIIDVRSPSEYNHAHIPNSHNVPLFLDSQRDSVGKIYKEFGRKAAILKGLDFASSKITDIIKKIEELSKDKKEVLVYCARGGMRSEAISWLLSLYGFNVYVLNNGYKEYRKYVLDSFKKDYKIIILGGKTGSGKTEILKCLKELNEEIIDLEGLANHKGSAFGGVGKTAQPTQEQFENMLSMYLDLVNINKEIWLEDESLLIGRIAIPKDIFNKMKNAEKTIYININEKLRATHITETYGKYEKQELEESIKKIEKRLGGERTKEAIKLLNENKIYECVITLLYYYDKSYKTIASKENIINIESSTIDFLENAKLILKYKNY